MGSTGHLRESRSLEIPETRKGLQRREPEDQVLIWQEKKKRGSGEEQDSRFEENVLRDQRS